VSNGLFSRTTRVSRYQKGKTSLDLNEARDEQLNTNANNMPFTKKATIEQRLTILIGGDDD